MVDECHVVRWRRERKADSRILLIERERDRVAIGIPGPNVNIEVALHLRKGTPEHGIFEILTVRNQWHDKKDSNKSKKTNLGALPVIPNRCNSTKNAYCPKRFYRRRHKIENFFCRIKIPWGGG
jgi:hypothetical protein